MADLETNVNENLIAAGLNPNDPAHTYTDFATTIAKNQAEQAAQEQSLALAKEHVKQAQFATQYEAPDSMTPEEARAYLKIIAQSKGLTIGDDQIEAWIKQLPAHVNRQIVEAFANRFARESVRKGDAGMFEVGDRIALPAGATAADLGLVPDEKDPEHFGHVPQDGMYQAWVDNQGIVKKYTPGGKEPVDPSTKLDAKMAESTEKQWQKLDKEINTAFKTRSGGLGSLSTAIFRSVRAINTINATENLTSQDLANIAQDVAGIFQGGSPTVVTARDNDYHLTLLQMKDWFRAQTGIMANVEHLFGKGHSPLDPTKKKLLQVCVDLRDSAIANLKTYVESEEPAFRQIIEDNPQRWADMQQKKLQFIESGLLIPPTAMTELRITGMDQAQAPTEPHSGKTEATKTPAPDKGNDSKNPLNLKGL